MTSDGILSDFLKQFGIFIPEFVVWIALAAIVLIAVALVAWGFFKEIKKK